MIERKPYPATPTCTCGPKLADAACPVHGKTRRLSVHQPAAAAWVRTEEDVRKYYETTADQIGVRIDEQNVMLSEMEPAEREVWIEKFIGRYRKDGWLASTLDDVLVAMKKAEQMAEEMGPGSRPIIGVAFSDSSKNVFWKGPKRWAGTGRSGTTSGKDARPVRVRPARRGCAPSAAPSTRSTFGAS